MPKMVVAGVVTSDRRNKTRTVEIDRKVKHPKYGKYIRRRTLCHVHDEENESKLGDLVEIEESRPISKQKKWRLLRVIREGNLIDIAALRSASKDKSDQEEALG
jgi:small subunit ribosomal protein S17